MPQYLIGMKGLVLYGEKQIQNDVCLIDQCVV